MKKVVKKKAVKNATAPQPTQAAQQEEKIPEGYELVEEEVEESEEPNEENLPDMPDSSKEDPEPTPITKNELLDIVEGHLNRAFELLRHAKGLK